MDHKWIPSSVYAKLPPNAVPGGNDVDGDVMYVGRAFHEGDMLVAKVIPAKQIAFVSFRGAEIPKDHFEILCGQNLVWRHTYNHIIPKKAVLCGRTSLDQPVYIGRGHYEGSLTVGKISSVHKALFIAFRGVERRLDTYEILVEENMTPGWQVSSLTDPLPSAPLPTTPEKPCLYPPLQTQGTYPSFSSPHYIPETKTSMAMSIDRPPPYAAVASPMPMPIIKTVSNCTSLPVCRFPKSTHNYPPPIPAATYPSSPQHYPSPLPTTSSHSNGMWVPAYIGSTPANAVRAGHDVDMKAIYVCRAYHSGDILPGKAVPDRNCAYFSHQGMEIKKTIYEMLVGNHCMWVPSAVNGLVAGAVVAGRTVSGEPLYVGRAHYKGTLTCGKIQRTHDCLYIPFDGREIRISHGYETLVDRRLHNRGITVGLIH